jgi:hypothetical protein
MYSLLLSDLRILITFPIYFSTLVLKVLNANKVSYFFFKNLTHVFLLKSSVKVTNYFDLDNDGVEKGPHKSMCIKSKTFLAFD